MVFEQVEVQNRRIYMTTKKRLGPPKNHGGKLVSKSTEASRRNNNNELDYIVTRERTDDVSHTTKREKS